MHYRPFFIFFLTINLIRIAAGIVPDLFLFGLDFYKYFPLWLSIIFISVSLLFLIKTFNESAGRLLHFIASLFYKEDGTIKWVTLLLFLGICTTGFYFLRVKPYLGDGVSRVQDLEKVYLHTLKDYFIFRSFQFLSVLLYDKTGNIFYDFGFARFRTFYLYNCLSGFMFLYFVFRLQSELFDNKLKRVISFFCIVCQAYLILFMGYIEYYAIPLAMSVMYSYYAIRCIKRKTTLWIPALILVILMAFHLLGVILLPSLIFLLLLKKGQKSILLRFVSYHYPLWLVLFTLIGMISILVIRPGPFDKLLISPKELFSFYNYAPYFIFHFNEILNLLILGSGVSLFLIVWFRKILLTQIKTDPLLNYFTINAFSGLLLVIFFNPSGNLAADWDIMTIPLLTLNILGIVLLLRYSPLKLNLPAYGICFSQTIIFFVIWFLVNTIDNAAAERITTIQNHSYAAGNPHKLKYTDGLSFKYYYFIEHNIPKCKEIAEICLTSVNDESLREYAIFFRDLGDDNMRSRFTKKYIRYLEEKISMNAPTWSDYYNLAAYGYCNEKQYQKAITAIKKAIELNATNYGLYATLGQTYEFNNDLDSALREYLYYESVYDKIEGLKIASQDQIYDKIFELFRQTGRLQESIKFFKGRSNQGYLCLYYLGIAYSFQNQYKTAQELFEKVLRIEDTLGKVKNLNMAQIFYINKQYAQCWNLVQKEPMPDTENWIDLVNSLKTTQWYKETYSTVSQIK